MFSEIKCLSQGLSEGKRELRLSVSWDGSWKNDLNCDGVYVFGKYRPAEDAAYQSLKLCAPCESVYDGTDQTPGNVRVVKSRRKTGIMGTDTGLGLFLFPLEAQKKERMEVEFSVTLDTPDETPDLQLFALEMVYVPEGAHEVGDPANGISRGGTLKNCLYTYPTQGSYRITSEAPIRFAPEDGCLYCDLDTPNGREETDRFTIPAEFPKGYRSMWYMKYSLTEGQFVQFLNCLTRKQQQARCLSDLSGEEIPNYYAVTGTNEARYRCEVYCRPVGNALPNPVKFYTAAPNRAMSCISYGDVSAFACFAGLRLITELEYEKACRGPLPAVASEFAWGSTNIGRVFNFDGVDGSGQERPVPQTPGAVCNCNFGTGIAPFERAFKSSPDNPGWVGPVTVGLFENADSVEGVTERERTGASYYGIMELSGNVWETLVSVGRPQGRAYLPRHGSGVLTEDGQHTMDCWPDPNTGEGVGVRGGVFISPSPAYVHMALRVFAAHTKHDKGFHGGIRVGY